MSISNNPPPFEAITLHIEDLIAEAHNYLDGQPIESQGQADDVGKLLDMIRQAKKAADEQRVIEKKPHDEAAKAVQARWKPVIDKCDLAASVAKKALVPWLERLEAEQRAEAERKRKEAEAAEALAWKAELAARDNLAAAEEAERRREEAERAQRVAAKAEKAKAQASGGARAVSLRTRYRVEIVDRRALLAHYAKTRPDDLEAWLLDQAQRDCNAGKRSIPGANIIEERSAA